MNKSHEQAHYFITLMEIPLYLRWFISPQGSDSPVFYVLLEVVNLTVLSCFTLLLLYSHNMWSFECLGWLKPKTLTQF
jgi:hypothetical protein